MSSSSAGTSSLISFRWRCLTLVADPRKNAYGLPILNASVAAVNEISGVGEVVRWIGGERSSLYETINNDFGALVVVVVVVGGGGGGG